jgi:hypothetical protein
VARSTANFDIVQAKLGNLKDLPLLTQLDLLCMLLCDDHLIARYALVMVSA